MNNDRIKKAYKEIESVCEKYTDLAEQYEMRDIKDMLIAAKNHLKIAKWEDDYGIKLPHKICLHGATYAKIGEYITLNHYGNAEKDKEEGSGRYISWSDNGRQPNNEWLLVITFPTGGYIFGGDYEGQKQLFQDFFDELKHYNPDFCDTSNKGLYWRPENASSIYKEFNSIIKKYHERNASELKNRKIAKMKSELAKLEQK